MAKYQKTSMHEGQNKRARLTRLDQLLRCPSGYTLKEIMLDAEMDDISERTLRNNLKELEAEDHAEFAQNLFRGKERLWRYKDITYSIWNQPTKDLEIIRQRIENLAEFFSGDPQYDMLRFYLLGLEKGVSDGKMNYMSFDNNSELKGLEHIEKILDAITNHYPLKMTYKSFSKNQIEVNLHPYHLRQYNRRWHIFGYSEEADEVRNYPLDRINSLQHLSKTFIETNINFEEYFDDIVGVSNYKYRELEKILLKVDSQNINYLRTKPIHWSQRELKDRKTEDYSYIELQVKYNKELEMLLFSYSYAIEVLEPQWLREQFANNIKKMYDFYKV